jgi:hypothetical protein
MHSARVARLRARPDCGTGQFGLSAWMLSGSGVSVERVTGIEPAFSAWEAEQATQALALQRSRRSLVNAGALREQRRGLPRTRAPAPMSAWTSKATNANTTTYSPSPTLPSGYVSPSGPRTTGPGLAIRTFPGRSDCGTARSVSVVATSKLGSRSVWHEDRRLPSRRLRRG